MLQREVSRVWREVVGVPSTVWPDLTVQRFNDVTHEAYLNPVFDGSVTHPDNQRLFTEVAKQVSHQLQDVRLRLASPESFANIRVVGPKNLASRAVRS